MSQRLYFHEKDEEGQSLKQFVIDGDQIIEPSTKQLQQQHNYRRFGLQILGDIFLPSGFPNSVTPDYVPYQIYDSLQAFSSSIAGLLASRAVLEGFGVGDKNASSTNAVLLSIFQDATGRLATILFAWQYGTALEPEAKMYRLAADIFNDSAFVLDCLSPALPPQMRVLALCLGGALRAVCGVCGGGAKAALSVHFAKTGNVGELNAKDSSQETVIGLLGMLCGSFVMSHVTSRKTTWMVLLLLLTVHLVMNYLAVRSVILTTLNRQRATIVYSHYRAKGGVLTPFQAARRERIFEHSGAIRDDGATGPGSRLGTCRICCSFTEFLHLSGLDERRKADADTRSPAQVLSIFQNERYLLWPCPGFSTSRRPVVAICFKENAGPEDHLMAWLLAYEVIALHAQRPKEHSQPTPIGDTMDPSLRALRATFPSLLAELQVKGWNTKNGAIVTKPVGRISATDLHGAESEKFIH